MKCTKDILKNTALKTNGDFMTKINFRKGQWEEFFSYAYCCRFPFKPKLIQEENCVLNGKNPEMADGFDYTTILTKEKYKRAKIALECSFEEYGAPLITLTNECGVYKKYHEVVLWEKGINVWQLFEIDGKMQIKKLAAMPFEVDSKKKHTLFVEIMEKGLKIKALGHELYLRVDSLPEEMYIGFTACENINRLYSVTIEKER